MSQTSDAPRPPDLDRRILTPFGYAVTVVVPILIAALGLVLLHLHYDREDLVSGNRLAILTSDWQVGDPASSATVTGRLTLGDDRCLRLVASDGSAVDLVWPADYEATVQRVGPADQIKVYDTERDIVARNSDEIELGGGPAPVAELAGRPCAPASGEVFVVQSEVRVVSTR